MATQYIRFVLYRGGRFYPQGGTNVMYFEHDREADAIAQGEAWLAAPESPAHPWYVVCGEAQDGRLIEITREST